MQPAFVFGHDCCISCIIIRLCIDLNLDLFSIASGKVATDFRAKAGPSIGQRCA